jgi:protein SCO1
MSKTLPRRARAILLAISIVAGAARAGDEATLKAGVFSPPRAAPDFTLQGSDGSELKLSRFRGKVVILEFGFTACADVCPVTLAVLAEARKKLGDDGNDLQIVYVTVDPKRDDAERLRTYLATFDPSFVGATGDAGSLEDVRNTYGVFAQSIAGGDSFSHSSSTYLIDRKGDLRALMPFGHSADDYVHDVRILLKQ